MPCKMLGWIVGTSQGFDSPWNHVRKFFRGWVDCARKGIWLKYSIWKIHSCDCCVKWKIDVPHFLIELIEKICKVYRGQKSPLLVIKCIFKCSHLTFNLFQVYCYLTDKQLAIREFFLKIFLKRTFGYRLVPATKITLVRYQANLPVLRIEDGYLATEICARDGVMLVSCFHKILLEKLGGSQNFNDKKNFFNNKLMIYHEKKSHKHVPL